MIGEVVIGGLIHALWGNKPHVERGWMKVCKSHDQWQVQPKNNVGTRECGFQPISELEKPNAR